MDDGSIKSKQSKGVLLNIQGFSLKDVTFLCKVISKKFGISVWHPLLIIKMHFDEERNDHKKRLLNIRFIFLGRAMKDYEI
jgi:hypothetical protein